MTDLVGIYDRSERGKLALTGAGAKEFLQGQITNDVLALAPGTGCYAAFLTPKGKMLGDLRVLDAGDELLLDCERVALQELFDMIRRFSIGYEVELHKRTLECGLLSVFGPDAVAGVPEAEHAHVLGSLGDVGVRAIRTDVGLDLLCDAADVDALKRTLDVPELTEEQAELGRIEQGRPRYGTDLDDSVIPQEAGLNERAVSFTKGCYVGQETVARLFYRGKPNRSLRGLRLSEPAQSGAALRLGDRQVGQITSVACSPTFGSIGLALVRREAPVGSVVSVGENGTTAEVVELPFTG
ncbi:MAG TPA: glycine cleavage T C-terminal barrel domain-containing protein [Solirubrobacteraceae bacterium]|nr:glycine cleavage T C-terminal barrel domain-containing protein [Solirubrobacteraceae bacterium]